ncbi:MAG: STAS domain-containing protein [Acidobacteria bacterium]|nr:STAS domain-containing protein [Acidobacteriota bacterium]
MSLTMGRREREGVVIVDLTGRIAAGEESARLRETLRELSAAGSVRVVLNLRGVDYIDSTGLGALVICYTTLKKAGGKLTLLNLSRRTIELLVFTKLATVFEIFDDEQEAVNSFFPDRAIRRFDILRFIQEQAEE